MFDVPTSDLQTSISVSNGKITGTLKKLTGHNAITDVWGEGNFLALDFGNDPSGVSQTYVGLDPTQGSGMQPLDEDRAGIFKITDKDNQKLLVRMTGSKGDQTQVYDLSELVCQ